MPNQNKKPMMNVKLPPTGDYKFVAGGKELLCMKSDGKFLINGKEVTEDIEIYNAFKLWLHGVVNNVKRDQAEHIVRLLIERLNREPEFRVLIDKRKNAMIGVANEMRDVIMQVLGVKETRNNHVKQAIDKDTSK